MKIKLSKSDWELIGQKTGWLNKKADHVKIDGIIYINIDEFVSDWYPNNYRINIGQATPFIVNAANEQDAMDELIDYLERHMQSMLFTPEEVRETEREGNLEDYYTGGNHGRIINEYSDHIRIETLPKDIAKPESWYWQKREQRKKLEQQKAEKAKQESQTKTASIDYSKYFSFEHECTGELPQAKA